MAAPSVTIGPVPGMIGAFGIVVAAGVFGVAASYVMWRAASTSGLWSLVAGVVLVAVAFVCAVLIGLLMTRAWISEVAP